MKIRLKVKKHEKTLSMEEEIGKRQLSGIINFYWLFIIMFTAILFVVIGNSLTYSILVIIVYLIILALYIIPLVGIVKRKSYAVPFT